MEHAIVTSSTYEEGVVYCDLQAIRNNNQYTDVPVMKPHSGFIQVPKQRDTVAIDQLDDGTRFIDEVISREDAHPDNVREGELAIQLDGGTRIQFKRNGSGDYNLHISASGDVIIDGIPFDDHTHNYKTSKNNTKVTEVPNDG